MPVHYLIFVPTKHQKQVTFASRKMLAVEGLMRCIERMSVEVKNPLFALVLLLYTTQNSLYPVDQNIHRKGLELIVVAP